MNKPKSEEIKPLVKIIGVGGSGINAVNRIIGCGLQEAETIAIDFDNQSLERSNAVLKLGIKSIYPGLTFPEFGNPARKRNQESAVAEQEQISQAIGNADCVLIVTGLGGHSSSGISPVVAEVARNSGALTIAIVTEPFGFEGKGRMEVARAGLDELRRYAHTLVVIPGDGLLELLTDPRASITDTLNTADVMMEKAVRCILDLSISDDTFTRIELQDIRALLDYKRDFALTGMMGVGYGNGKDRVSEAVNMALKCPLIEKPLTDAGVVLMNIALRDKLQTGELLEIAQMIPAAFSPDVDILFNARVDMNLQDELYITLICTFKYEKKLYLDIDGVLLGKAAPGDRVTVLANHAREFLDFCLEHYKCYWLTTHCHEGDTTSVINLLKRYSDDSLIEIAKKILPANWRTLKTEAIDFHSDFCVIDDGLLQSETEVLKQKGALQRWLQVDTRENPDDLKWAISILRQNLRYA